MKYLFSILSLIFLYTCENTTQLVDYWKNPTIQNYTPNKVLIIGMTKNQEAKEEFENEFETQLQLSLIHI